MKSKTIPESLIAPLNAFLTSVNTAIDLYRKKNFPTLDAEMIAVHSIGGRYAKLAVHEMRNGEWKAKSVYAFIDLTTGDVCKGSWRAPERNGVRGNLNDADILTKVTVYGVAYLRGGASDTISNVLAANLGR